MSNERRAGSVNEARLERGNLIVVAAPSGGGKSTLVARALSEIDRVRFSISYTTRKPRGAERHGTNYYFVSEKKFMAMRERGEFLESALVHGHYYGTHRNAVASMLDEGFDVILDIDVQGARQIRKQMPKAVQIFILPPSQEVLVARLTQRSLNAPGDLAHRLNNAKAEVKQYRQFKYVIVNEQLDRAFVALKAIIEAERQRTDRQVQRAQSIIATFRGEHVHG